MSTQLSLTHTQKNKPINMKILEVRGKNKKEYIFELLNSKHFNDK